MQGTTIQNFMFEVFKGSGGKYDFVLGGDPIKHGVFTTPSFFRKSGTYR